MVDYAGLKYVQIDAGRIGGITIAKDVADYAAAEGVTYVNHTQRFRCDSTAPICVPLIVVKTATSSPAQFQSRQRPGACAEFVGFDAEPLEHVDVKIAQWRRAVDIEGQVLTVLEATASDKDREVLRGVTAAVTEVAAQEDAGAIEQAVAVFL